MVPDFPLSAWHPGDACTKPGSPNTPTSARHASPRQLRSHATLCVHSPAPPRLLCRAFLPAGEQTHIPEIGGCLAWNRGRVDKGTELSGTLPAACTTACWKPWLVIRAHGFDSSRNCRYLLRNWLQSQLCRRAVATKALPQYLHGRVAATFVHIKATR